MKASRQHLTWWSDEKGYPIDSAWERLAPYLEVIEQFEATRTIKHRLEVEGLFVEVRSQDEDEHLLIGNRDGSGDKAHLIIDGKSGEIRTEDGRQEVTELTRRVETILTLPSGKRIRTTREAIEEIA